MRPRDFDPLGLNTLAPWGEITKITFRNALYLGQSRLEGLHNGIGPPSNEGTIGAATATYVQTNPTIRNNILTARFMDCSPCVRVPWERVPSRHGIITETIESVHNFVHIENSNPVGFVELSLISPLSCRISATYDH
jgi:hypothetical protein